MSWVGGIFLTLHFYLSVQWLQDFVVVDSGYVQNSAVTQQKSQQQHEIIPLVSGLQTNFSTGSTGITKFLSWSHQHMIWLHPLFYSER